MPADARSAPKIGTLSCNVSVGLCLVVTSTRDMRCQFRPSRGVLIWGVVAETRQPVRGGLAGDYAGAYISNNGYTSDMAIDAVAGGDVDLIAFGKPFIAYPDLVERLRLDAPLK